MIRLIAIFLLCLGCWAIHAATDIKTIPPGFLWYNLPKESVEEKKPKGVPFKSLSYQAKDKVLRYYTMEALHKARLTHNLNDMKNYLSLQDYWLRESSKFSHLFQKAMLYYPEFDYSVTNPTSSIGTKLYDDLKEKKEEWMINALGKTHGILFFYRSQNPYDIRQIPIVKAFSNRFHIPLIPVSVDGEISSDLGNSRMDKGQANALGVRFFPAMILVNPKTKKTAPIAYGLTTQDVLIQRLMLLITNFKGEK